MDIKYLKKVLRNILSETHINYKESKIYFPWFFMDIDHLKIVFLSPHVDRPIEPQTIYYNFFNHCIDVYGLTEKEIDYIWPTFKSFLKDIVNKVLKNT